MVDALCMHALMDQLQPLKQLRPHHNCKDFLPEFESWRCIWLDIHCARDSLEEAGEKGIKVAIGLREGSPSWEEAEACGFSTVDGTLGEVFSIIAESDLVILLISDAAQVHAHPVRPTNGNIFKPCLLFLHSHRRLNCTHSSACLPIACMAS